MIDARELRTGNYISFNVVDNPFQVTAKEILMIENGQMNDSQSYYLEPIQLTEKWLIDFGWGKGEHDTEYYDNVSMDQCILAYNVNSKMFTIESHRDIIEIPNIEYVHTLQNVFYALTGKELTLKTNV